MKFEIQTMSDIGFLVGVGYLLYKTYSFFEENYQKKYSHNKKVNYEELEAELDQASTKEANDDPEGIVDSVVLCPVCQRGDVWQEAVSRTQYVFEGQAVKDGQEVIDYLLAEVAVLLNIENQP